MSHSANCLPPGTQLGPFQLNRVIGEGGFGIVYLARDAQLDRTVAIKEYMPSSLAGRSERRTVAVRPQHRTIFEAGLKSFINEARLLAKFSHPALVQVYQFFEMNDTAYMVMRYYKGATLSRIVADDPSRISEASLSIWMEKLIDAVDLLHKNDCFHRDIAPDNILIQEDGSPILLDFGAARRIIGDMAHAMTMVLKPGYAPIEQYADEGSMRQGAWTDIYQLAATMYFAITGRTPSTSVSRMIEDVQPSLVSQAPTGYRPDFLAALDHALALRPENRPQSVEAFRCLLRCPAEGNADAGAPEASPDPVRLVQTVPPAAADQAPAPTSAVEAAAATDTAPDVAVAGDARPARGARHNIAAVAIVALLALGGAALTLAPPGETAASTAGKAASRADDYARDWAQAGKIGTVDALSGFLARYPEGQYAREARAALASLAQESPKAQPGTPAEIAHRPASVDTLPAPPHQPASAPPAAQPPAPSTEMASEQTHPSAKGVLQLQIAPWGRVFVDGSRRSLLSPPANQIELPEGHHTIRISNGNGSGHFTSVDIKRGETSVLTHQFEQAVE